MRGPIAKIGLYWHTLRFLKLSQIVGRLVFRFKRVSPDLSAPPALRSDTTSLIRVASRSPSLIGKGQFKLLNEHGDLAIDGWDNSDRNKLWRYNQHYFDDLNASKSNERSDWHRHLITSWIAENPPGLGSGWEPYPTSLRIVNWVKWSLLGGPLDNKMRHSLAVQTRWFERED